MIRLLSGLVDDAGLFPPSSLSMPDALARHRASDSAMLSRRFLLPADRVDELVPLLDDDEKLEVHLVAEAPFELPDHPDIIVRAVELRSSVMTQVPCYVEGVPPRELAGHGVYGKVRCTGISVEELALYLRQAARVSLPFKATAGLHAAVRGWESTDGEPHHGYLNLLLAASRALTAGDVEGALSSTDADALAQEAHALSTDVVTATRWLLHSYGSCDTVRPVTDAKALGLL